MHTSRVHDSAVSYPSGSADLVSHFAVFASKFDFLEVISQPATQEFDTKPYHGQEMVRLSTILCGRENAWDTAVAPKGCPFAL